MRKIIRITIAVLLVFGAVCAGPVFSGENALRPAPLLERNDGIARLEQLRDFFTGLPAYSNHTARLFAVLDVLLGRPEASMPRNIDQQTYAFTRQYLGSHYPDLGYSANGITSLRLVSDVGPNRPVVTFEARTASGHIYIITLLTEDPQTTNYKGSLMSLPSLDASKEYRLREITTNESFPWEYPFYYVGAYLKGETNREGAPLGPGRNGAWAVKPGVSKGDEGPCKGDFQFFVVEETQGISGGWERLAAQPQPGNPADLEICARKIGEQSHTLVRDASMGVMSDIITGPAIVGGERAKQEALLITALGNNGNAGFGLWDYGAGKPYEVSDAKIIGRSPEGQRGVQFHIRSERSNRLSLNVFQNVAIGSMRYIRDWARADEGKRKKIIDDFFDIVCNKIPFDVHAALWEEGGLCLHELLHRSFPVIRVIPNANCTHVYIIRYGWDGHLYCVDMKFPLSYDIRQEGSYGVTIVANEPQLNCDIVVTTDFPPAELAKKEELFTPETLNAIEHDPELAMQAQNFEMLFARSGALAGSHRFLQYFSRDTIYGLMAFSFALNRSTHEALLQSVLSRVSPDGRVPMVEELGNENAYEAIEEFCRSVADSYKYIGDERTKRMKAAARVLGKIPEKNCKYRQEGPVDTDFMVLPAIADYLKRSDISNEDKARFLASTNEEGISNFEALMRNAHWVLSSAEGMRKSYDSNTPLQSGFVGTTSADDIVNWHDVGYGNAYGKFPFDVNGVLIPMAVRGMSDIITMLSALPLSNKEAGELGKVVAQAGGQEQFLESLNDLALIWESAQDMFDMRLSAEQIGSRVRPFVTQAQSSAYAGWYLDQPLGSGVNLRDLLGPRPKLPAILHEEVHCVPISLKDNGDPVPVICSDAIIALRDEKIPPGRLIQYLIPMALPYPVGLWTPAGVAVTSSSLSRDPRLWEVINNSTYGGTVSYYWQMEYLKHSLIEQFRRIDSWPNPDRDMLEVLYSFLRSCDASTPISDGLSPELISWEVDPRYGARAVEFGKLGHNEQSNPVQFWSISLTRVLEEEIVPRAQALGLTGTLRSGELLDRLSVLRDRYPIPPRSLPVHRPLRKPNVAELHFSIPMGGGGTNIVALEQVYNLVRTGYHVSAIGGASLAGSAGIKALEDIGADVTMIPELNANGDIETEAASGCYDTSSPNFNRGKYNRFRERVDVIKSKLKRALNDIDVVVIHQMMTVPMSPDAILALSELASEFYGHKRFIAWVHNTYDGPAPWPMNLAHKMCPYMEYVAVSEYARKQAVRYFGVEKDCIDVIRNGRGVITFAGISEKVLDVYTERKLYEADMVFFYPSRMDDVKRLDIAVWIIHELNQAGMDARLVIATPMDQDMPNASHIRKELERLIDRLGLSGKVVIYDHRGDLNEFRNEMANFNFLVDGMLFSSSSETYGIPVIEAMMMGVPVRIGTDLEVFNELFSRVSMKPVFTHVIPPSQNRNAEEYAKAVSPELVKTLRSEAVQASLGPNRIKKLGLFGFYKGHDDAEPVLDSFSAEHIFNGAISPLANVPAPDLRRIRAGSRNFGGRIEDHMKEAGNAKFPSFEITCDRFKSSDILSPTRVLIKDEARKDTMRLSVRLENFARSSGSMFDRLMDGARLALDIGAQVVTVKVDKLTPDIVSAIEQATQAVRAIALHKRAVIPNIFFSIENVTSGGELLTAAELSQSLQDKNIGVSLWLDSIIGDPVAYLRELRPQVSILYAGEGLLARLEMNKMFAVSDALNYLREQRWRGNIIAHLPRGDLYFRRWLMDRLIDGAYMAPVAVEAKCTGIVRTPPSTKAAPLLRDLRSPSSPALSASASAI